MRCDAGVCGLRGGCGPICLCRFLWVGLGALNEAYLPGRAYRVSGVVDSRTGERFGAGGVVVPETEVGIETHPSDKNKNVARVGHPELWLVTGPRVADATEKQRLASTYGAALVDMEAAAVARLAAMRGIPFYCIKGVSDGLDDRSTRFQSVYLADGRFNAPLYSFCSFPAHGTGPHSSGWARIAERLPRHRGSLSRIS